MGYGNPPPPEVTLGVIGRLVLRLLKWGGIGAAVLLVFWFMFFVREAHAIATGCSPL